MKKKIFIFLIMVVSAFLYAETYEELLKKAEQYEAKKEWFFALGSYYDAIKIANDSDTARQKFGQLSDCIKNGNPGYGSFNDFTLHDEWVNLIKNAEKYFTETFPYSITFDSLESSSINYEKKTADYKLSLEVKNSSFYDNALEILRTGYQKARRSDWKDLESNTKNLWFMNDPDKVGYVGIHNTGIRSYPIYPIFTETYKVSVYNTKYTSFEESKELAKLQTDANTIYKNDGVALSYFASTLAPLSSYYGKKYPGIVGISVCEAPAFVAKFSTNGWANRRIEMSTGNIDFLIPFYNSGKQTCYDLKLGIYDETGKLVIEGTRQTICTDNSSYFFNNIPKSKLAVLDTDYDIKIIGIWLNYGLYDITLLTDDDIKNDTIRGIVKPLPDIKIKTKNVEFNGGQAWTSKKAAIAEKKRLELQKARFEEYDNGKDILLDDFTDYIYELETSKPLVVEGKSEDINFSSITFAINHCSLNGIILDLSKITNLTSIPESAFANCTKLKSIILPDTIIRIEDNAFYNCTSLEEFKFPENIQEIGKKAFANCSSLNLIVLPDKITELPENLFFGCSNLQEISLFDVEGKSEDINFASITIAINHCSSNGIILDLSKITNLTSIPESAFANCTKLKSIILPDTIIRIEDNAFYNCTSLEEFKFPENIQEIGKKAFANCSSLISIVLPDKITELPENLFSGCSNLQEISLSDKVNKIGKSCFSGCEQLKSINLQNEILEISEGLFLDCKNLEQIVFSEKIKKISKNAFANCMNLRTVIIPNSVTEIDDNAFMKCKNLEEIRLSENLIILGEGVFSDCENLKSLILPEGFTRVDSSMFKNSKITEIKLPKSLQEIADGTFEDCPLSTVIYSGSSKQWKQILINKKANKKFLKIKVQFENK